MTQRTVLTELLDRLSAKQGTAVSIGSDELELWPADAVAVLKAARILVKSQPAFRVVCPGCERHCLKPVEVMPAEDSRPARIFIVCNEPEDFGLIAIQSLDLERWQITGDILAEALSRLLDLDSPQRDSTGSRWSLGLLKGTEGVADVMLAMNDIASLVVAGHTVPVAAIVKLDSNALSADTDGLLKLVNNPRRSESPKQRRERIRKRVQQLKARGIKDFLEQAAREERLSVPRVKQLCQPPVAHPGASLKRNKTKHR